MSAWSGKRFLPFYFVFALSQFSRPRLSRSGEVCSLACQVRVSCITCITSVAAVVSFPQRPLCVGVAGRLPRDEAWGHYQWWPRRAFWLFSDDLRPCKGIFDEVEAAFPPRTILDMRLFRWKSDDLMENVRPGATKKTSLVLGFAYLTSSGGKRWIAWTWDTSKSDNTFKLKGSSLTCL